MQTPLKFDPSPDSGGIISGIEVATQAQEMFRALASGQYGMARPPDAQVDSFYMRGPRVASGKTYLDMVWWDGVQEYLLWSYSLTDGAFAGPGVTRASGNINAGGTTGTLNNITVTKTGTGLYAIVFVSAPGGADYKVSTACMDSATTGRTATANLNGSQTSSGFNIVTKLNGTPTDTAFSVSVIW